MSEVGQCDNNQKVMEVEAMRIVKSDVPEGMIAVDEDFRDAMHLFHTSMQHPAVRASMRRAACFLAAEVLRASGEADLTNAIRLLEQDSR